MIATFSGWRAKRRVHGLTPLRIGAPTQWLCRGARKLQSPLEVFVDGALSEVFFVGEVSFFSDFSLLVVLPDSVLSELDWALSPEAAALSCERFSLLPLLA